MNSPKATPAEYRALTELRTSAFKTYLENWLQRTTDALTVANDATAFYRMQGEAQTIKHLLHLIQIAPDQLR
jgi:hypothetical protein